MTFTLKKHETITLTINDMKTELEADFTLTEDDINPLINSIKSTLEDEADENGYYGSCVFMSGTGESITTYKLNTSSGDIIRIEANTAEASITPDTAQRIVTELENIK